jgi:ABC-type transport system substrate-binding protein
MLGLMVIAALVFILGSCGGAEDPTPTPTKAPAAQAQATPTPVPVPTPDKTKAKYGGIAISPNPRDPPGWDHFYVGTIMMLNMGTPISGEYNLIRLCRGSVSELCEGLADSWSSNADFTQWTFNIRDNAKWSDGTPFTATDAKWWLELACSPPEGRAKASWCSRVTPASKIEVDGSKLVITLTKPALRYLNGWTATGQRVMHPRHLMQPEIDKGNVTVSPFDTNLVSTGPYTFQEYERGSVVKIRRSETYWEKDADGRSLPNLDGVDFPIITDFTAIIAAFRAGRVDMTSRWCNQCVSPTIEGKIKDELGESDDTGAYFVKVPAYPAWFTIDSNVEPWSDIRVRKAVNLWMDRQAGLKAVFNGLGQSVGMFISGTPYANPDQAEWPGLNPKTKAADRARAKELLTEAGYPNGFKSTMLCRSLFMDMGCEWAATEMNGLLGEGNFKIDSVDTATFTARFAARDWETNFGSAGPYVHPEEGRTMWMSGNGSFSRHTDTSVDAAFDELSNMPDGAARTKKAQELEKYFIYEKQYAIPLWIWVENRAYRSYIKGVPRPEIAVNWSIDMAAEWMDK